MGTDTASFDEQHSQLRAAWHLFALSYGPRQDGEVLFGELVRSLRSALAGQQAGQALAIEQLSRDIINRPRQPKGFCRLHHRTAVLFDAAQHLVLDLDQVVRIEECTLAKERIRHGFGMG